MFVTTAFGRTRQFCLVIPSCDNGGEQRFPVSLGQPPVKAGFLEKSVPRDGTEGTEERALALHTEELSVREGVLRVGVRCRRLRHGPMSWCDNGGEQRSPVSLGQSTMQLVTWRALTA